MRWSHAGTGEQSFQSVRTQAGARERVDEWWRARKSTVSWLFAMFTEKFFEIVILDLTVLVCNQHLRVQSIRRIGFRPHKAISVCLAPTLTQEKL